MSQNCFFANRPQNRDIGLLKNGFGVRFRCASFDFWSKKANIRAGFRIRTSHPGRASHPDRAGHPIRSYLGYVWPYIYPMCAIRAYMATYGPIWDQISPTTARACSQSMRVQASASKQCEAAFGSENGVVRVAPERSGSTRGFGLPPIVRVAPDGSGSTRWFG